MKDIANQRYGKLIALTQDGRLNGQIAWSCKCDCGRVVRVRGSSLRSGKTLSCGCSRNLGKKTHGKTGSAEYRAWSNMRTRCYSKKHKDYPRYGGRGIKVHPDWLGRGSFARFLACVGPRPSELHSLDRINSDGDYEPGNVRWATAAVQARNTRTKTTNKSGVTGLKIHGDAFVVSINIVVKDFFEACCIRKSIENRVWRNPEKLNFDSK